MTYTRTAAAALGMALTLAASLIAVPARAGLLSVLPGAQESSRLAKAYAVLREDFYPTSVAWSPDGRYIADTGILTNTIHVWDVNTRQAVQTLQNVAPTAGMQALAWSPDGRYLVGCGAGLRIWDAASWSVVRGNALDPRNTRACSAIAFSSDGRWLALSSGGLSSKGETCVYSVPDWQLKRCTEFNALPTSHGFNFQTDKVAFRPGTNQLAIATTGWFNDPDKWDGRIGPQSGRVLFWDVNRAPPDLRKDDVAHSLLAYPQGSVSAIAYSPDGKQLATGNRGRSKAFPGDTVIVWDASTHALLAKPLGGLSGDDAPPNYAIAYTTDGRYLLAGFMYKDGPIDIIDARTLQLVDTVHALGPPSTEAIAVEPHGNRFAVTVGASLMVWTLQDNH